MMVGEPPFDKLRTNDLECLRWVAGTLVDEPEPPFDKLRTNDLECLC